MNFTGEEIPQSFVTKATEIIRRSGFPLNHDKILIRQNHESQIVVGLTVNGKKPNVPREIRRDLRKEIHIFEKFESKRLHGEDLKKREQQIQGKKSYVNYIDAI